MSAPVSVPCGSKSVRGNSNDIDRLGSLSDDLLHFVMSFLPMPEVVRTSLLSPRWRYLWASTPFIRIDRQDFKAANDLGCLDVLKLEKFADHLLLLRDGTVSLDEARITISGVDNSKSSVWICHAIKHKVRFLHVSGYDDYPILDSTAMFPSQHLKRIRLQQVCLTESFTKTLNRDFPLLEHLELELCDLFVRGISLSSLKVLCIIDCLIGADLLISSMSLTHLSIIDPRCSRSVVVTRDMPSLVSASISLRADEFHYDDDDTEVSHHLLGGLSHATILELHAPFFELAFERGLQECPMFSNLTSLVLGDWCLAARCYPLFYILHRSPKMKELTVKLEMDECETCEEAESAALAWRGALPTTGYPCIERIKICCIRDDSIIGALMHVLQPIFTGRIDIEVYESIYVNE